VIIGATLPIALQTLGLGVIVKLVSVSRIMIEWPCLGGFPSSMAVLALAHVLDIF
jgi:hypothetical protein